MLKDGQVRETVAIQACVMAPGSVAKKRAWVPRCFCLESACKWKDPLRLGVARMRYKALRIRSAQTKLHDP